MKGTQYKVRCSEVLRDALKAAGADAVREVLEERFLSAEQRSVLRSQVPAEMVEVWKRLGADRVKEILASIENPVVLTEKWVGRSDTPMMALDGVKGHLERYLTGHDPVREEDDSPGVMAVIEEVEKTLPERSDDPRQEERAEGGSVLDSPEYRAKLDADRERRMAEKQAKNAARRKEELGGSDDLEDGVTPA